jgi:hypothetical protein
VRRFDDHMAGGGMALITVPIVLCTVILSVFGSASTAAWLVVPAVALVAAGAYVCLRVMWAVLADGAAEEH